MENKERKRALHGAPLIPVGEEYNRQNRFCPECGRPLDNGNQRVHFKCMVKRWREGDRDKKIKQYFRNRGYCLWEVDELAKEGE